jgi:hypothetical protein
MATMPAPPSHARCVFYEKDTTGLALSAAVKQWFVSMRKPPAHGTITVRGRRGDLYELGVLTEESQGRDWPIGVHDWLRERRNMPDALVVVWQTDK